MYQTERVICSVSQLNNYIKNLISKDEALKYVLVKGEISNFKCGANGHCYFSLKDSNSLISAVMFKEAARKLIFSPKEGDEVICFGSVNVYEARGNYQLYVSHMEMMGLGQQLLEFEKLKKKLAEEGLFDTKRKREIIRFPNAIGVISAKNSAALEDILTNIKRRYPIADIYVFPSAVQGVDAPKELLKALTIAQSYPLDTLIIGRGGGASEDLSAFNDETLARAVANSKIPVIAAVGHEIDYTIIDYVADLRVSTPTGAAEKATPDRRELEQNMDRIIEDMQNIIINKLNQSKKDVSSYKEELLRELKEKVNNLKRDLAFKKEHLSALNPTNIMKRGYSITLNNEGRAVKSINDVNVNDTLITLVKDGKIVTEVKKINKGE